MLLHGEDDQIVPVKLSSVKSERLIKGASPGTAGPGVLITQCLQNDFVKPLAPFTPCPTCCTSATMRRAG